MRARHTSRYNQSCINMHAHKHITCYIYIYSLSIGVRERAMSEIDHYCRSSNNERLRLGWNR